MKLPGVSIARFARAVTVALFISFLQTVVAPFVAPQLVLPQATATTSGIVTSGLALDINASNSSDMSTSNVTLGGSSAPSYTSSGGGYYTLNPANSNYISTKSPVTVGANRYFSVFMWVYPIGAGQLLSHLGQPTINTGYHTAIIDYSSTDQMFFGLWNGGDQTAVNSANGITTPKNNWYYVGLVYDGTKLNAYINGVLSQTSANFTFDYPADSYFGIGAYDVTTINQAASYGNMRFGGLSVYTSALTASQVSQNYLATQDRFGPAVASPTNQSTFVNRTATFTSSTCTGITSGAAACNYQWQVSSDNGVTYTDISGATNSSYTTPLLSITSNGYKYRMKAIDPGTGTTTANDLYSLSGVASLSVSEPPGSDTDTAIMLTGASQYAEKTESGATPFDLIGDVTLQAWVYPTSDCAGDQAVVAKLNSYMLYCGGGIWKYVYDADGLAWAGSNSTIKVIKNEWHHIAYAKSGTTMSIYLDGNVVQTVTGLTSTMTPNNDAFQIGRYGTSSYFQGEIDEVKVYNSSRSQSQIQTDMHNYGNISDSNLIAYYDFNEGLGSTLYNRVAAATSVTDLTVSGLPTWIDVKTVNTAVYSAYTIVKFDRSYLTSTGGWRAPTNVSAVSALVVGGGGGGGWNSGGGGGGGGFLTLNSLSLSGIVTVKVGTGGRGGQGADVSSVPAFVPLAGDSSTLGSNTVSGGNKGGVYGSVTYGGNSGGVSIVTISGSSGAGGAGASNGVAAPGGGAGLASTIESTTTIYYSMGGGGGGWNSNGGAPGGSTTGATGGGSATLPGSGGGSGTSTTPAGMGISAKASTGGGGGASSARVDGGNGGSGVIIVRWITATKPIFTQPTIDTTTAGLTDTITVSANPLNPLTRNYQWQVSTDTGTTWANASTGSGITTSIYTTPVLETNTSGIRYQYRVIVTDSDTAGLFIVDTSVAVYIVINPKITYTGSYTIQKYGSTHQDTFTVINGTGNKTFTYSPNNRTGITWSSPAANTAVLTIGTTLFVGTYFETITATDTKGAQTSLGISIVVSKADTITVTAIARTETYTGSTLTFTPSFTVTGLKNSDTVTAAAMSWNYNGVENSGTLYSIQSTRPANAGTYTITPVTPSSLTDSYTAVSVVPATLTVNRATRTLSLSNIVSPLKFGSFTTFTATPSAGVGDGSISYSTPNSESCTISAPSFRAIKSSGTCFATALISQGFNFETATSNTVSTNLAKADTLTVTVDSTTSTTYTGSQYALTPTVTVTGLKNSNTVGVAPVTLSYASSGSAGSTCSSGGTCSIGDTGPGGGTVFYDAGSQQSWGRYLEIAKSGWNGAGETTARWCSAALATTALNVLTDGIGQGLANSTTIASSCGEGAAYLSRNYNGGGKTNWYLPTLAEFTLMYNNRSVIDLASNAIIWLSVEPNDANKNWVGIVGSFVGGGLGGNNKADLVTFRPIRAFAAGDSSQNFVSTKPIDADTYTVRAAGLTLSSGSISDYVGVSYVDGSLRINRAQQSQLFLAEYGAIFGTPYRVIVFGGSGTGASKVTTTSGTATGCAISGETLTTTSIGTCLVTAVKAQDKNYETATVTISVYFLEFVIQQPTPTTSSSSGPGIALTGLTSVTLDPYQAPSISSISISSGRVGDTVTITGLGFTASALQSVKFWRNILASVQGTPTNTQIIVLVPAGALTGKIAVITANGTAITEGSFTVLP